MHRDHHTIGLLVANPTDRALLAGFLEQSGLAVHAAELSRSGLLELGKVSLVITDEHAARAEGKRLLELKWRSGVAFFPLLILLPQRTGSAAWLEAGFDDVLRFPISKAELTARLGVFLRLREQSVEHYRDMFENALIGIYRTTPSGRVLIANPALVRMLGYASFEELAQVNLEDADQTAMYCRATFKRSIESQGEIVGAESCWIRKDGTPLFVRETARAVRDAAGATLYYDGMVEDVTELKWVEREREQLLERERAARKEAEQAHRFGKELLAREQEARADAEAASRAKDEFLAVLSHELRTPLNALLGWTSMLRGGRLDSRSTAYALETIERSARTQARIIEDLLDVSRIITGKLSLDMHPVDLGSILRAVVDMVRPTAEAKGIVLSVSTGEHTLPVLGDANRLQQVVWNLLSNALKFTPQGGRIEASLDCTDSHAEITVSDTGQGIKPDFLPYVFDRFRQADSTTTRSHGGLGLGLAIVRHLIELHGGAVEAFSDGDGLGARFKVKLPVLTSVTASTDADGADMQPQAQPARGPQGDGEESLDDLRVLVIEDDDDSRNLITAVLESCRAKVKAVSNPREALVTLKQWQPEVLISDIEMPGEDGYSFIRKLRSLSDHTLNAIPTIALTAHVRNEDRARALSAGFTAHVCKPVRLRELIDLIGQLTGRTNGGGNSPMP